MGVRPFLSGERWTVGNLDVKQALRVRDGDLLVVVPLPLVGVEGSPCRVLALRLWLQGSEQPALHNLSERVFREFYRPIPSP